MSIKPTSVPTKTLASSITAAATSFTLNNIIGWDTTALVAGDFGSQHYCVFRNAAKTQLEIMEIDPTTIASASITIVRRGLDFTGDLTTEITANKLSWTKGDTFVDLGTDTPQLWQWLKEYIDTAVVSGGVPATTLVLGVSKMSVAPVSAANPIAVGDNDPRIPNTDTTAALVGTPSTPNTQNKFTTQAVSIIAGATINGATLPVPVYQNTSDNEYYACDGNDTAAMKFQGFAISNGTNGNAMLVQTNGIVGGFSALDEGVAYYLSDTAGAIQNTPGTYPVLVGIAISTTQLLIQKGARYASGGAATSVGIASGSTVVTCGFRPSKITINGYCASSGWYSSLSFLWVNGVISAIASFYNEASGGESSAVARLYEDNAADFMEFSITSVTNTGFTIVWTEAGTFANPAFFMWSAEGDI